MNTGDNTVATTMFNTNVASAMPNASYFIFDLPESLLLSQHYLMTLHPEAKAALYPESAGVIASPDALRSYRLLIDCDNRERV